MLLVFALSLTRTAAAVDPLYSQTGWEQSSSGALMYPPRPTSAPQVFGPVQGGCTSGKCVGAASVPLPKPSRTFKTPEAFMRPDCGTADNNGDYATVAAACMNVPRAVTPAYNMPAATLTFTASGSAPSGGTHHTVAAAYADIDGDGDLDLFLGNAGDDQYDDTSRSANQLFINNGFGSFTEDVAANGPSATSLRMDTRTVAFADVDGDGDPDLFVGNSGTASDAYSANDNTFEANELWINGIHFSQGLRPWRLPCCLLLPAACCCLLPTRLSLRALTTAVSSSGLA